MVDDCCFGSGSLWGELECVGQIAGKYLPHHFMPCHIEGRIEKKGRKE